MYLKVQLIADKVLGKGDFEVIRQCNYYSAQAAVKGLYRILINLLSPKTVIGCACKLWKQFYDRGDMVILKATDKSLTGKLEHVPDIPLYHDIDNGAFFAELLRLAGAKNVKSSHPKCMARGDDHCLFELTWE